MVKIGITPKKVIDNFYITFKNIDPVQVLIKITNNQELPPDLPENIKIYSWLPQLQVLS